MSTSIYDNKLVMPDEKMLSFDLGASIDFLNKIKEFIEIEYGHLKPEWKYYSKKSGWILKLLNKKRNVLFVVPCDKYFRIAFTFGERASDKIFNSDLPETIRKDLAETRKYAEGRTILIEVRNETDLYSILRLIEIKLAK